MDLIKRTFTLRHKMAEVKQRKKARKFWIIILLIAMLQTFWVGSQVQGENQATIIYSQPPDPNGGFYISAWWSPDESPYDEYCWDNFTLESPQEITDIQWRGGYDPAKFGGAGAVLDFTVAIYGSTALDSQPDVTNPPLVEYQTGGDAGQTAAGTIGGVETYDYHFTLPVPFVAQAGTKYWLYIVAEQNGRPDWGFSRGTNGDSIHFRNLHEGNLFQQRTGDFAFTLLAQEQPISGLSVTNDGPTDLGQPTTFSAAVTSGENVSYTWDFGDETTGDGPVVQHIYKSSGSYLATVTASNESSSVQATTEVTVLEPPAFDLYMPVVLNPLLP